MDYSLNEMEARILGVLVEKQMTTPEYYPLTLNALRNGCNQKSNRHPVTNWSEAEVKRSHSAPAGETSGLAGENPREAGWPSLNTT